MSIKNGYILFFLAIIGAFLFGLALIIGGKGIWKIAILISLLGTALFAIGIFSPMTVGKDSEEPKGYRFLRRRRRQINAKRRRIKRFSLKTKE